jgi:ectoine hydroxylase
MNRSLLRHIEHLKARGYTVVDSALDPQTARRLCGIVDARFDRHRIQESGVRYLHEFGCVALDKRLAEPLHSDEVLAVACAMLGWNIWVYHSHLDVNCPIPAGEFTYSWHRDGGRMNPDLEPEVPLLSVKAGFFLTDLTVPDSGQMW